MKFNSNLISELCKNLTETEIYLLK